MEKCVACASKKVKIYAYPEGKIFICRECKLQWAEKLKTAQIPFANCDSHYMDSESIKSSELYKPYQEFFNFLQNNIKKSRETDIKILDVGCGNGIFITESLRRGYNTIGVEADEEVKKQLIKKLQIE